jgi:hypothetical protein
MYGLKSTYRYQTLQIPQKLQTYTTVLYMCVAKSPYLWVLGSWLWPYVEGVIIFSSHVHGLPSLALNTSLIWCPSSRGHWTWRDKRGNWSIAQWFQDLPDQSASIFRVPHIDADWSVRSTWHNCGAIPQVILDTPYTAGTTGVGKRSGAKCVEWILFLNRLANQGICLLLWSTPKWSHPKVF